MDVEKTNTFTLLLLEEADAYQRWIFERIRPYLKGTILEVGCGIGNLTGLILNQGSVLATDVEANYLDLVCKKYGNHPNFITGMIWDIQTDPQGKFDRTFDTILCSNVLEHIEGDVTVLRHFQNLLSEGGRLVLLVPALKWLYNQLDRDLGHVRRYTKKELVSKMEQSGFRILEASYFNPFGISGWFFNGSVLKRHLLPKHQVKIFNRMVPLFKSLEKVIPKWVGQSLIAAGEKT